MAELLILLLFGAAVVALGLFLFANLGAVIAVLVVVAVVSVGIAILRGGLGWLAKVFGPSPPPLIVTRTSQEQPPARNTAQERPPAPAPTAPPSSLDLESLLRSALDDSIRGSTATIDKLNTDAAAREEERKKRMEQLIASLNALEATLPSDAGVLIEVAAARHLVNIRMMATWYSRGRVPQVVEKRSGDPVGLPGYAA